LGVWGSGGLLRTRLAILPAVEHLICSARRMLERAPKQLLVLVFLGPAIVEALVIRLLRARTRSRRPEGNQITLRICLKRTSEEKCRGCVKGERRDPTEPFPTSHHRRCCYVCLAPMRLNGRPEREVALLSNNHALFLEQRNHVLKEPGCSLCAKVQDPRSC